MPYIYTRVSELQGKPKVGTTECVALVQFFANAPHTSLWKPGATVLGNHLILPGTAIATFIGGHYPNKAHGNHAALYLRQDSNGLWIMDQWSNNINKPLISQRFISLQRKNADGTWLNASNNAGAFSVIERR